MSPSVALGIAVISNVMANIFLKYAMLTGGEKLANADIAGFLKQPWIWLGGIACVVLLASYLLAIREIGLSTSYAVVTTLSLVIITIFSAFLFDDKITAFKIVGILFIVTGIVIMTSAKSA